MSLFDEHDALGLAGLVAAGDVSPTELLDEAIGRVDALDADLHVLADRYHDFARAQIESGLPAGPFTGVPFLRKDSAAEIEGLSATDGVRLLADNVATTTSVLGQRFLESGVVVFGATAVPPMCVTIDTDRSRTGPCGNPWDPTLTPGGSSSGAAAVVGAGALPLVHGNDGGGSLRIPAAWSGAFTVKPSRGRVPNGPTYTEIWMGFATDGVITRSVRDSAAMLDAISGRELGNRYVAPEPQRSYLEETKRPCSPLRIAMLERTHAGAEFDPDYLAATHRTAELLTSLGHHVETTPSPEFDVDALSVELYKTVAVDLARGFDAMGEARGKPLADDEVEDLLVTLANRGRTVTAAEYARVNELSQEVSYAWDVYMQQFDLVLSPTMPGPPPPLGEIYRYEHDYEAFRVHQDSYLNMTMVQNVTGQPAMSVPLWQSPTGLPIGMMFVARYGDEPTLFSLAAQLEEAEPWWSRRPNNQQES